MEFFFERNIFHLDAQQFVRYLNKVIIDMKSLTTDGKKSLIRSLNHDATQAIIECIDSNGLDSDERIKCILIAQENFRFILSILLSFYNDNIMSRFLNPDNIEHYRGENVSRFFQIYTEYLLPIARLTLSYDEAEAKIIEDVFPTVLYNEVSKYVNRYPSSNLNERLGDLSIEPGIYLTEIQERVLKIEVPEETVGVLKEVAEVVLKESSSFGVIVSIYDFLIKND